MKSIIFSGAFCLLAGPAMAQAVVQPVPGTLTEPIATPAAVITPIAEPKTENAVLRAGTSVAFRLMEEVTTKKKAARVGQRFMLEVAAPVEVNGVTVVPSGAPAWGEITSVRNKGMWGKSGKLEARLLFLRVNGRQIRLTGAFDDKGVTGTGAVVGALVVVPIAGFFTTGTSAVLPKGGAVNGFIDEDVTLAFKQEAPAPMQVPVAAPPMEVSVPETVTPAKPEPATPPALVAPAKPEPVAASASANSGESEPATPPAPTSPSDESGTATTE